MDMEDIGLVRRNRVAQFSGWWVWIGSLLALLSVVAAVGCTADDSQPQQGQPQEQAQADQQQTDEVSESKDAAASAEPEPQSQDAQEAQQSEPSTEQQAQSSTAEAMQRDDQSSDQQESDDAQAQPYAGDDPYGADGQESGEDESASTVAPVRRWLADGMALTPSVPGAQDEYGWSAVVEGDVLAVGAPYHDAEGIDTGAVFIFERMGEQWVETAYLLPPYPDPAGWFGRWLAIGDGRIVIGAPYEDGRGEDGSRIDDSGVAYVYEKVNGQWLRTGTLLPAIPYTGASFGWSVAISGDRIAVSAWEDPIEGLETGSVTVFSQHKGLWRAEAVLQPDQPSTRLMFGRDIELHDNVLVVGAPGDDTIAEDAGAVYVWHRYNNQWNFAGKLLASDGIAFDRLGSQVALHLPWLAAGAYDHDDPMWSAGATYVWRLENLWEFHDKVEASDMQPGDWFGYSVDIKDDRMVVGAPHRAHPETGTYRSGAAYTFELVDGQWEEVGVLGPVDAVEAGARAEFGWVTEIDGTTAVVGAWLADTEAGVDAGAAAVYELPTSEDDE